MKKLKSLLQFLAILALYIVTNASSCTVNTPHIERLSESIDDFNYSMTVHSREWQNLIDSLSNVWTDLTQEEIERLVAESDEYQEILHEFNGNLEDFIAEISGFREDLPVLIDQIEFILSNVTGSIVSGTLCVADVIQVQLISKLDLVLFKLGIDDPNPSLHDDELLAPVICHSNLTNIDLSRPIHLRNELTFSGFGIKNQVVEQLTVKLNREAQTSPPYELPSWRLSRVSDTQLVIDLQSDENGVPFDDLLSSSTKLELWFEDEVISSIPIFH